MVVRPLLALERAPGRVRLRLVVARRRDAGDLDALRRRQRARPALPPGDRRPGRGDAGRDVPRAGSRSRSAPASSPTSTSPASRGRTRRSATRGCASASTSCARCSRARWSTTTASCASTGRGCGRCPAEPPPLLGTAVSVETAGWVGRVGGRADHDQPAARAPRADARRVPRGRRRGQAGGGPGAPVVGAEPRRRRCAIAHDQWRTNVFPPPLCWDLATVEQFDEAAKHVRPEDLRGAGAGLLRPRPPRRVDRGARRARASTRSTSTTSARSSGAFIDAFGEHVLPRAVRTQGHQRPVVEERGRLLPRRRDVPRLRRRRLRRPRRASPSGSTTSPGSASPACG